MTNKEKLEQAIIDADVYENLAKDRPPVQDIGNQAVASAYITEAQAHQLEVEGVVVRFQGIPLTNSPEYDYAVFLVN